jgi:hypothetical protein
MSIWIRALCTKPLDGVTKDDLRAGIARRLPALAAQYGEEGQEETLRRLVVSDAWDLDYRGEEMVIGGERWKEPEAVREEVGELLERLEDCEEDEVDEVRELLGDVVESVGFELKLSDCEGIGWPLALAAAAVLAEKGEGLVQADGEGWMAPEGDGVEQVLDGD